MRLFVNPERSEWEVLCRRASVEENPQIEAAVAKILRRVERDGDRALRELAQEIDNHTPTYSLKVSYEDFREAEGALSDELKEAIEIAIENISAFHRAQLPREIKIETKPGVICVQCPVAIEKVGIYIPGGTAPLFSTVLMLALPARIAGCSKIVMCTPCGPDGKVVPAVLYAARRCGVSEVFRIGGAQAIGAMACGTESVPRVNKIFGPGNRYVTTAKQLVSTSKVAIDMPAGPSEVMILADSTSRPDFVAADLLSQCEHGADSQGIVVCSSVSLAEEIEKAVRRQAALLSRESYVDRSLANSRIIVFEQRVDMLDFANTYGAEHLILSIAEPMEALESIKAAGSVFIGNYSPESAGDYASGTNHTLPTSGWAHSYSGVNTESFMRKMTIQELTPAGLENLSDTIIRMAEAEGLDAHARAVTLRLADGD